MFHEKLNVTIIFFFNLLNSITKKDLHLRAISRYEKKIGTNGI